MKQALEDFLLALPQPIIVVGGSPLCAETFSDGISINGFHPECRIAAINSLRSDVVRTRLFEHILQPYRPKRARCDRALLPRGTYALPAHMPDKQPTTCFSLLLICETIGLTTHVHGMCGWASRHHDGDWEMHWMKQRMKHIKVHDPRPRW